MKQKLTIFIYSLGGGGAEKATINLAKELKDFYDVKIVVMSKASAYNTDLKVEYLADDNIQASPFAKIFGLFNLAKLFAKKYNDSDIVLCALSRPIIISALAKKYMKNTKFYAIEHTTPSRYYPKSSIANILMLKALQWSYFNMDKIFAVSSGGAKDLYDNFGVKNAEVLPNGIDIKEIINLSKEQLPNTADGFKVVSVGRLVESKNQALLISAIAMLQKTDIKLILVGDGSERKNLEKLAKELGVDVLFAGFDKNPYKWIANADIFAYGSNLESLPTVLLEALALKKPVISTDCPNGPREILGGADLPNFNAQDIEFAKYGILTKMQDKNAMSTAIKMLYEDNALLDNFAKSGVKRAEEFGIEVVAKKYIKIFNS